MELELGGRVWTDFVAASVTDRLDALCKEFSFELTSQSGAPIPFRGGESCRVKIDGQTILSGYIEKVSVDGGADEHTIKVEGRSRTADILDSAIAGALSDIRPPTTLSAVCNSVIAHIGSDVGVFDTVNPAPFAKAIDVVAPEPAQNCFEFLEQWARKRQCLLSETADGRLWIRRADGVSVDKWVQQRAEGDRSANNVLSYSVSYDLTNRFRSYEFNAQLSLLALVDAGETPDDQIVDQRATVEDSGLTGRGRQMVIQSESMFAGGELEQRAVWERDIRRARSRVYSCEVSGPYGQDGQLWKTGELPFVRDDLCGIDTRMLCNSVAFSLDADGGTVTTLGFVERGAYRLQLEEPVERRLGPSLFTDPDTAEDGR